MRLAELPDGHSVAVDTETSGKRVDDGARVSIVSFAFRHPDTNSLVARAIPFDQGHLSLPLGDKDLALRHRKRIQRWSPEHQNEVAPNLPPGRFIELLGELSRFRLIYHGRKYDETMLATGLRGQETRGWFQVLAECSTWDTMIAQHVLEPQYPLGLKPTARRLELTEGGEDEEQQAIKPFLGPQTDARFDLIPWSVIGPYATQDAILTLLLEEYQQARLEDGHDRWLTYLLRQDFEVCSTLINMERRGMGWNVPLATEMLEKLKAEQKRVASELPFEPTPNKAKKFFFLDVGREPYPFKKTDTCRKTHPKSCVKCPQLDTEVQELLIRDGVEWAPEYRHHEKVKSAISKWYQGWTEKAGADGRLRCDFDQTSVATGRLGGRHINLVAIPHDDLMPRLPGLVPVRQLIEPKPGHSLWHIDMAQAEVRVGAAIAECVGLLEGFQNGVDAHSQMAILIFGDAETRHRRIAKTLNLAIQYGAGLKKIKGQLEKDTGERWSMSRTKEIYEAWHQAAPEMSMAMDLAEHQATTLGYVQLWNDRFRWFEHYRGGPPEQHWTAFNGQCQGGVAEIMKRCMSRWDRLYPETLVDQIHDALVLELPNDRDPEDIAEQCANLMKLEFEKAMRKYWRELDEVVIMPFEADVKRWEDA